MLQNYEDERLVLVLLRRFVPDTIQVVVSTQILNLGVFDAVHSRPQRSRRRIDDLLLRPVLESLDVRNLFHVGEKVVFRPPLLLHVRLEFLPGRAEGDERKHFTAGRVLGNDSILFFCRFGRKRGHLVVLLLNLEVFLLQVDEFFHLIDPSRQNLEVGHLF